MDLSIIIVNYNTQELLAECLRSVYACGQGVTFEIIVVDNASVDGSVEMLHAEFPEVIVIANKDNVGFAKANNQGLRSAKGRYHLLLNSDTIVLENCFQEIIRFADQTPPAGVVGCRVLNRDRTLQYSCYHHPSPLTEFVFFTKGIIKGVWDPVTHWKYMKYWDHKSSRIVDSVSGCFFLIRREVVDRIGGLDEKIFMYFEDAMYCQKLVKQTKWRVYYCAQAQIIHLGGASSDGDLKTAAVVNCFKGALYYFRQCYGPFCTGFFYVACRMIWLVEIGLFSLLKKHPQFQRKYELLKELSLV